VAKWLGLSVRLLSTLYTLGIQLPIDPRETGCHNFYCIVCEGLIVFYCTTQCTECMFTLLFFSLLYKLCAVLGINLHITIPVVTVERPSQSCHSCVVCIP
jgi:hypothetical protein